VYRETWAVSQKAYIAMKALIYTAYEPRVRIENTIEYTLNSRFVIENPMARKMKL